MIPGARPIRRVTRLDQIADTLGGGPNADSSDRIRPTLRVVLARTRFRLRPGRRTVASLHRAVYVREAW